MGIDQGSSHTRAALFSEQGVLLASAKVPIQTHYPKPGWVEHDPNELLESAFTAIRQLLRKGPVKKVAAIGIANQRSTVLCWDRKTGTPLSPAISWQDQRTASSLSQWDAPTLKEKTGLPLTCYYSATKLNWLLNRIGSRKNRIAGTINTFLIWHLTRGRAHKTDPTNAQRTLLYNISDREWDTDLMRHFKIPRNILPELCPNQSDFGEAVIDRFRIPITASIGDQQSSLIGLGGLNPGTANLNYGTGGFFLINTGEKCSVPGLLSSIAWSDKNKTAYLLEGTVNSVGAFFTWLKQARLLKSIAEIDPACRHSKESRDAGCDRDAGCGVFFLPALTGLGAPHFLSNQKGVLLGFTATTKREDIIRGAVEGIAHLMNDIYRATPGAIRKRTQKIIATGGGAVLSSLIQFQADLFGKTISIAADPESTIRGAAFLAGKEAGVTDETCFHFAPIRREVAPQISSKERARLIEQWQTTLASVLNEERMQGIAGERDGIGNSKSNRGRP